MQRTTRHWIGRFAYLALVCSIGAAFFGAVLHHVIAGDLRPLAAFGLPVLVAFFSFTSLLYMRGRSLARGSAQVRTLFAAENAMHATVCHLLGIASGASVHGLLQFAGIAFDPAHPSLASLWLLLWLLPWGFVQAGLLLFQRAAWVVAPQFLRPVTVREVWRRVARAP
jgi:hypothetical protein